MVTDLQSNDIKEKKLKNQSCLTIDKKKTARKLQNKRHRKNKKITKKQHKNKSKASKKKVHRRKLKKK